MGTCCGAPRGRKARTFRLLSAKYSPKFPECLAKKREKLAGVLCVGQGKKMAQSNGWLGLPLQ